MAGLKPRLRAVACWLSYIGRVLRMHRCAPLNILRDLQAATVHPQWSQPVQDSLDAAERLTNGQLLADAQGWRASSALRAEVSAQRPALKSAAAPVALNNQKRRHLSVAFAQP